MEDFEITIPELKERGLTYEEFYRFMLVLLHHQVHYLRELHPSEDITDLQGYPLTIAKKIVTVATTLRSVIERDRDYVTANAIIRSLADYLSAMILIYEEPDEEIRALRHYLYVLDGAKGRLQLLPDTLHKNGFINDKEYTALNKQIQDARTNYSGAVNVCIQKIKELPLYVGNNYAIKRLIDKNRWKFKSIQGKDNYSWIEMYKYLYSEPTSNMPSFIMSLSEFVHGLSMSNVVLGSNESNFSPIYGIGISILGRFRNSLNEIYSNDMETINTKMASIILDQSTPVQYLKFILGKYKVMEETGLLHTN